MKLHVEETKSEGRKVSLIYRATVSRGLHENSVMSPLQFISSKISIQKVYFTRWHVHNREKYTESIAFALPAHLEVYWKCILSKRIRKYCIGRVSTACRVQKIFTYDTRWKVYCFPRELSIPLEYTLYFFVVTFQSSKTIKVGNNFALFWQLLSQNDDQLPMDWFFD